ncbi:MFS transporter, SP family, general alpha glucoside:H+ symporter, partial [Tremellales sp. Uapishka_1]
MVVGVIIVLPDPPSYVARSPRSLPLSFGETQKPVDRHIEIAKEVTGGTDREASRPRGTTYEAHAMSPFQAIKIYHRAALWCLFGGLGALLWGYDAQISGGTLSIPAFRRDFGTIYEGSPLLPARWQSALNSASSIGGIFGGLTLGWLADKLGRRSVLGVACIVSLAAVFIQFFSTPHRNAQLLVGKLINGYSLGLFVSGASNYAAELSPVALRGVTTASVNLLIVLGQFLSNCVIQGTGGRTDSFSYRIPLHWVFPVLILIGLPFAPESPWWLIRHDKIEASRKVIAYLSEKGADVDGIVSEIQETIALEKRNEASTTYFDCFRGTNLRRTMIGIGVFVAQQATGVVFVLGESSSASSSSPLTPAGYSSYFFQLAGFDTNNSFKLGVGVTAIGVVGNLFALFTVNHFGRRNLFLWGTVGCTLVNFIVAISQIPHTGAGDWSMAIWTIIYNLVYQVGIGPLGYVIYSEVGSARLKSKSIAIGIAANQILGVIANVVIPYLVNPDEANLGGYVGWIFGGLGVIAVGWTWLFVPETKYRTVDELDLLFENRIPPRRFGATDVGQLTHSN